MKLIILDYFKRWWLVLTAILITYFAFQSVAIHEAHSQTSGDQAIVSVQHTINTAHNVFIFQAIMWLGFLLVWDIQRGLPRILISMPVTAKKIGRAWWLASVAFPAIAVGAIGLLAVVIFSGETNSAALLEKYSTDWVFVVLYLGAVFGAQTFGTPVMAVTFAGKIRNVFSRLLFVFVLFGFIFIQLEAMAPTVLVLFFSISGILTVLGWFRAEQFVLQRAGFRFAAQSSNKNTTQHKTPQSFGGLPYLVQKTFVQITLISFAIIVCMSISMLLFSSSHALNRVQEITAMINGGSTSYIFVLIFSIIPIVFQLRFLRTLPISSSALAATLVLLPVFSITVVGIAVTAIASLFAGEAIVPPSANVFLMLDAKAAIAVLIIIWRGLEILTYLLIMLMAVSGSFISLGLTLMFHLTKTLEYPLWFNLAVLFLCLFFSFALTRRLLTKSSNAYRVRTMPTNAWSMARR